LYQIDLVEFLITMLALVFAISVHEFAHAWTAMQLGDRTAYYQGRVTLHPAAHLDPVGAMMILISSFSGFGIGWGKPVPVNPYNLKYGPRVGRAITAAAGPVSNILQAVFWAVPIRLDLNGVITLPNLAFTAFFTAFWVNLYLALFNLIPLAPLDGFSVLRGIFATIRARWAYDLSDLMDRVEPYTPMLFLLLIFMGGGILSAIIGPPARELAGLILGVSY
jgi:Zn-dependent protease